MLLAYWCPDFAESLPALTNHSCSDSCFLVKQLPWRPQWGRGLLYSSYPKKSTFFNMAVTESDLDPKPRKMPMDNFLITLRKISSAWDLVAEMLLILKITVFDLIIQSQVLDMTVQRNVPRFCMGSICGWNLQPRWGCLAALNAVTAIGWLPNFRCDIGL